MFYPNNNRKFSKNRSVCKNCFIANKPNLLQKRFGLLEENISSKQDSSSNQDISNKEDRSNKQEISNKKVRSRKQNSSSKQVSSNEQDRSSQQDSSDKQDTTSTCIIDVDPNLLSDKLREILSKPAVLESCYTMGMMILDELVRIGCIKRKQYNAMCEKIETT